MCGRYGFDERDLELASRDFPELDWHGDKVVLGRNLSPGRQVAVIEAGPQGPQLAAPTWGLRLAKLKSPLVNVKVEGITAHRMFGPLIAKRRCLVPVSFFYEWQAVAGQAKGAKQPWLIRAKQGLLYLGAVEVDGTFAILTTTARGFLAPLHGREPVMVRPEARAHWLAPAVETAEELRALIRGFDVSQLEAWPVSSAVGNANVDDERLLAPIGPKVAG